MFKIIILCLFMSSNAFAAIQVNAFGGLSYAGEANISATSFTNIIAKPRSYMAYGLLANIKSAKKSSRGLGLSFGAFYVQGGVHQEFGYLGLPFFQDLKKPYLQVPVAINYWFGKAFSLGLGGYYGWALGNIERTGYFMVAGIPIVNNNISSFGQSGYRSHDYGLIGQAQLKLDISKKINFMLIAIYEMGLLNIISDPGFSTKNSIILAMAGLGYTF